MHPSPVHRPNRRRRTASITALAAATVVLALAACSGGTGAADTGSGEATTAPATEAAATAYSPVDVDNCGTAVSFTSPPERVVTIKSTATEMLLALGLGDRIVGSAFSDGPVPASVASAGDAAAVPVLADKVPSQEIVLGTEPDLVYAGWESNVTEQGAGDRAALSALGVNTYVSPSACKEPGYKPASLSFDDVFGEITEVGSIFGAETAADELIAEQTAALDAVVPDDRGLTALWYSSGTDTPYVGAGSGAPQMIMDAAGLTNIAADVDDTWSPLGWEVVVAADPDVIVLVDATWNTAESKIAALEANPATAALPAVVGGRYITVPFAATEAGVRNVAAVTDIVDQLDALG